MSNAIAIRDPGLGTPYLPRHVAELRLGSVTHGKETRHYRSGGREFTDEQRAECRELLAVREAALDPDRPYAGASRGQAVLALVTTMLLGFAFGDQSELAADARFDLYEVALDGVPAWAVAAGIVRWARGECPPEVEKHPNYKFAPCPATLRALARLALEPWEQSARHLHRLLTSVSIERAMDPAPLPGPDLLAPPRLPSLRRM